MKEVHIIYDPKQSTILVEYKGMEYALKGSFVKYALYQLLDNILFEPEIDSVNIEH